ncbi:MAG: LysM peptidoglycan-binding domain-containing protein [Anaerolineaceae bacterium]|nr:LysM peptidoglycan-binding domain-containing protein [Anaerolineaceae bacterium]
MKKNTIKTTKQNKICPVCGTRLASNASRCLVCGTQLNASAEVYKKSGIQPRQPSEVRMGLPAAIGFAVLILALIALVAYFAVLKPMQDAKAGNTPEPSSTKPATRTSTPTETLLPPPQPTWTPQPPVEYSLAEHDTCLELAARFNISVDAIIIQNKLDSNCTLGTAGSKILIPVPTATASPIPSPTTEATPTFAPDCDNTISVVADANTTLSGIAANYNVPISAIMDYNHMTNDVIVSGQSYIVPLCDRLPTPGPTPTPTPLPPYPAPNLLLPASGASFAANIESVTLQWASVANLQSNEKYRITVQDLTSANEKILVEYAADTKFTVPLAFRPQDNSPHIIQWSVSVARQINSDAANPIYEEAGLLSEKRVFSWIGTGQP